MPSWLSFFTDEKTEPWVYEKYTEGHTVSAGGAGTQIQLDPENPFSLETQYLHMKAILTALTILLEQVHENSENPCMARSSRNSQASEFPSLPDNTRVQQAVLGHA